MSRSEVGSQPRGPEVADCWTRVVGQSDDKPGADMDTRRMLGTFNVQSALLDNARPLALTSGDMSGSTLRSAHHQDMPGSVVDVHGRNSEDDVYFENVLRIAGSALRTIRPRVPTISTPLTIATVAVSPPTHEIKIKRSAPITDVVTASNISEVHTVNVLESAERERGYNGDQGAEYIQHRVKDYIQKIPVANAKVKGEQNTDKGRVAEAIEIRKASGFGLSPKADLTTGTDPTSFSGIRRESKRKDDLISKSPEFAQVSQSTIDEEEGSHWTWLLYS
ncbi:hypothetical protein EDB85DRAFT_1892755 [Lactarius pseudohatsudake]|nr:hypothetical protein EDB85DRAFT_1892755 [Lactarius pseudohatsudake]